MHTSKNDDHQALYVLILQFLLFDKEFCHCTISCYITITNSHDMMDSLKHQVGFSRLI